MPEGAVYMNPVIISSPFEWLTRKKRSAFFLLFETIFFFRFVDELFLQPLLFSIPVGFLLVGNPRLLIKVLLCILLWTKNTFICLKLISQRMSVSE